MSQAQVLSYLREDPSITHFLLVDVDGLWNEAGEQVTHAITSQEATQSIKGHDITISWDAHCLSSTRLYTTKSIYNDRMTRLHGLAVTRKATRVCGTSIRATVLKSLEMPELL